MEELNEELTNPANLEKYFEEVIHHHIQKVIFLFTQAEHQALVMMAKEEFSRLTGDHNWEDSEYEAQMSFFYDWYTFQYLSPVSKRTIIQQYLEMYDIPQEIKQVFLTVNFSVFQFDQGLMKKTLLKDLIHNKKIKLLPQKMNHGLVPKDVFIGHILSYKSKNLLLDGVCVLPSEAQPVVFKEAKRVDRLNSIDEEKNFLLQSIYLKNKAKQYGHVQTEKIFIYPNS